uniref:Uncharacterized protein n=1 Tax=Arundo donax TaxID=35708 RepID=A0A0A8ZIU5_ARUDO
MASSDDMLISRMCFADIICIHGLVARFCPSRMIPFWKFWLSIFFVLS